MYNTWICWNNPNYLLIYSHNYPYTLCAQSPPYTASVINIFQWTCLGRRTVWARMAKASCAGHSIQIPNYRRQNMEPVTESQTGGGEYMHALKVHLDIAQQRPPSLPSSPYGCLEWRSLERGHICCVWAQGGHLDRGSRRGQSIWQTEYCTQNILIQVIIQLY